VIPDIHHLLEGRHLIKKSASQAVQVEPAKFDGKTYLRIVARKKVGSEIPASANTEMA